VKTFLLSSHLCAACAAGVVFIFLSQAEAGATIYAKSGSLTDVRAAVRSAKDGDTVIIRAGTFTWSAGITLTKAITLQGAGAGNTIIRDARQTGALLQWDLRGTSNGAARLTGIEFQDGGRTVTTDQPSGLIHIDGSNTNGTTFRWDHCAMTNLNGPIVFDTVIGVFDHNVVNQGRAMTQFYYLDSYWNNDSLGHGDQSYAAPTNFGGSQFLFLEDNTIAGTGTMIGLTDSYSGARYVIRHNQLTNVRIPTHGTESSGRYRGVRAVEIYRNTWTATVSQTTNGMGLVRSGIMLFHDNSLSGYSPQGYGTATIPLSCFRMVEPFGVWPGADGTSVWDVNHPGGPFYSGSAASNSVGTTVTVAGNPNFTTNQWVNYSIKRTSNICNSNSLVFGLILSNTSNTIKYTGNTGDPHSPPSLNFCTGDTFQIWKVDQALDQPGRARGSLITGYPPVPPAGWNDQVTEPCYSWGNLDEFGHHVNFVGGGVVRAGEHFFNDTPMPGYTEYVYPHPLTKGVSPSLPTTPNAASSSSDNLHKKKKQWAKKLERKKGKKAKENSTNGMAEGQ
jgi:hypothetical protein